MPAEKDVNYVEDYIRALERKVRELEQKNRELEGEMIKLDRERALLKAEIDRLRTPPMIAATVIDTLEDGRAIVKSTGGPNFVVTVSQFIKPEEIKPGVRVALSQRSYSIIEVLPSKKDPLVLGMEIEDVPKVSYSDIGGLEEQIREVKEAVELPLLKPELFKAVGITPPKGVLLYGAPGTGKTLLAKAVAHETKATFIRAVGSELVQKYIGEGARLVREMFELARENAPSIVFIDEIDAIAARRLDTSTGGDREVHRTLMQFLAEIDGFDPLENVRIIAATNRPDILDPAILRPGRFDRLIYFPLPDEEASLAILKIHVRSMNLSDDVNLSVIAKKTEKATGADLQALCMEAGMFAIRDGRSSVTQADFERAIAKIFPPTKGEIQEVFVEKPERIYGY
ncbi:MAG: proteasome-activating nucleotidase [Candidatus Hadarchaeales archaeon]